MKKIAYLLIFITPGLFAQISVSNQLEYSNWQKYNRNIIENWTDVSYQQDNYAFGFRYEINQPPDPFVFPRDSLLKQEELTYRYAQIFLDNLNFTIGNFYALFGRGMVLRTYEDRNLRVDNNIEGLKIEYYTNRLEFTALGGRMRDKYNRRNDRLYATNVNFSIIDQLQIGGSIARNQREDHVFKDMKALRFNTYFSDFELYGEMVKPSDTDNMSYYLSFQYISDFMTFVAEYKDYNRLAFFNSYQTEYNAPPALTREHSYTLLNRHPHVLNTADETGYQFEATTQPFEDLELLLNYSITETHNGQKSFEEYYGQMHWEYMDNLRFETAFGWNYDFATRTENTTPIFMAEYEWQGINAVHAEFQHQHVKNTLDKSEYDNEMLVLEYSRSPHFSLSFVGEYSNKADLITEKSNTTYWAFGQATVNLFRSQQLTVLYGSRQAGFVCAGGVCRFEPEFEGVEIELLSRF